MFLKDIKKGDQISLIATVEDVVEGYQHADFVILRLHVHPSRHGGDVVNIKATVTGGETEHKTSIPAKASIGIIT